LNENSTDYLRNATILSFNETNEALELLIKRISLLAEDDGSFSDSDEILNTTRY
jgi:hypothetical protein